MRTDVKISEFSDFKMSKWHTRNLYGKNQEPMAPLAAPYFVAVHFTTRYEHDGYGGGSPTAHAEPYAFMKEEELNAFVSEMIRAEERFVFFKVEKVGEVERSVRLKV